MSITAVFLNAIMPMVRYTFWLCNLFHCHQLYVSTLSMKPCRTHKKSTRTHLPIDKQRLQRLQLVSSKDTVLLKKAWITWIHLNTMWPVNCSLLLYMYQQLTQCDKYVGWQTVTGNQDMILKSIGKHSETFFRGYCFVSSIMLRIHAEPGLWLNPNT